MEDQVKNLLADGNLADAIGLLIASNIKEGHLLLFRLNSTKKEYQCNFISYKHYDRVRMQIANAVLEIALNN